MSSPHTKVYSSVNIVDLKKSTTYCLECKPESTTNRQARKISDAYLPILKQIIKKRRVIEIMHLWFVLDRCIIPRFNNLQVYTRTDYSYYCRRKLRHRTPATIYGQLWQLTEWSAHLMIRTYTSPTGKFCAHFLIVSVHTEEVISYWYHRVFVIQVNSNIPVSWILVYTHNVDCI